MRLLLWSGNAALAGQSVKDGRAGLVTVTTRLLRIVETRRRCCYKRAQFSDLFTSSSQIRDSITLAKCNMAGEAWESCFDEVV